MVQGTDTQEAPSEGLRHRKPPHAASSKKETSIDASTHGSNKALQGYMPLEAQVEMLMMEKEELQRSLKEQLLQIDHIRESASQMMHNVELLQQTCLSRIHAFDREYREAEATGKRDSLTKTTHESTAPVRHPGKVFRMRDSRLSVLLEIKDIATVYNIFVAILPLLFVSLCVQNYYESGKFIDFSLMFNSFSHLDIVAVVWIGMFSYAVLGYMWKFLVKQMSSQVLIVAYISYQTLFALSAAYCTLKFKLPVASGFIVMCEQARLSMKTHSFFREHSFPVQSVSGGPQRQEGIDNKTINHYLYFLFCPTLLYRTSYPRTPFVRWGRVIGHFGECTFTILDDLKVFLSMTFNSMFPSMVLFVFGFFGILHSWLNLWSELLQFGDREFYRDWWNSYSFSEYYRKWNGVVYDWLFTYVYLEFVSYLESKNYKKAHARTLGALFVIEVSAIIHEFILACALGYCFPVLLLMYGGPGKFL
ncbi:Sterol O-acyltransferase 1 [Blyttiomyces sp. JEL0837]|nr:Sterol O-acyltransferase 1 [Blyttiomyces sp. JEL0837]